MPLSERASGALEQGDILDNIEVHVTDLKGEAIPADADVPSGRVLVVSRPCKAIRAEMVSVVLVRETKFNLENLRPPPANETPGGKGKGKQTFNAMYQLKVARQYLEQVRDGKLPGKPDQFYLGALPDDGNKRSSADLENTYTVQVPKEGTQRNEWVEKHRIARLSFEHRRELHLRRFRSEACEGYDEFEWLEANDISALITAAHESKLEIEQHLIQARKTLENHVADHKRDNVLKQNRKKLKDLEDLVKDAEQTLEQLNVADSKRKSAADK